MYMTSRDICGLPSCGQQSHDIHALAGNRVQLYGFPADDYVPLCHEKTTVAILHRMLDGRDTCRAGELDDCHLLYPFKPRTAKA